MKIFKIFLAATIAFTTATGFAAELPKYAANAPESVLTPNKVKTDLLGDLEFFDGVPKKATTEKVYDFLDLSRGVQAFKWYSRCFRLCPAGRV